jgi:hypothetical protein
MIPLLEEQPNVGLAYCQSWQVDSDGNHERNMEWWTADLDGRRWTADFSNQGRRECADYLLWKNTIPNASAVLLRKKTYLRAGGAPLDMRLCGDWLTWARILMKSDLAFSSQCLNHFRFHGSSVRESTGMLKLQEERWRVRRYIASHWRLPGAARRVLASQALDEWLMRLRTAPPAERRQTALKTLMALWPFFIMAPVTTIKAFLARHRR